MSKAANKLAPSEPAKTVPASQGVTARAGVPTLWSDPFAQMRRFSEEVDRVFNNFGLGRTFSFPDFGTIEMSKDFDEMAKSIWSPRVDVVDREGHIVFRADLPGLTKEDISVEIDNNVLAIRGERKSQMEEKKEKYYRSERSYGSFYRSFRLPDGTDGSKAKATFKDGVLEVELPAPVRPESTSQRLEIE